MLGVGARGFSRYGTVADHPHLAAQFDIAANGGLAPVEVSAGTSQLLWWACPAGPDHRWQETGGKRVRGYGCPFCSGKRVSVTNSLARHPHLVAQFDTAANAGVTPAQIVAGTQRRLWWLCPAGPDHRWQESGARRLSGIGCPFCAGYRVSVTNSVASIPELAAQFDVDANGGRTPEQVVASTGKLLWWACPAGPDHRWQASGNNRVYKGSGCPMCAGKRVSVTNSLARYPQLASQLDVTANEGLTPEQVVAGTSRPLWWHCPAGPDHRWQESGSNRVAGYGCPFCAGYRVSVTNSVASIPALAAQFDVDANGGRTADQVVASTSKPVWWVCSVADDHRWRAPGRDRVFKGVGCPMCASRRPSVTNSLARHPELAGQFDVDANDGLTPDQVVAGTHDRLWWACPAGSDHRWSASGHSRVAGNGCPACAGYQVSVTNNLPRYPELAAQFDVDANGRTPEQVLATSSERWWWSCTAGPDHRWRSTGANRVKGSGCPACAGKQLSVTNNLARHPQLASELDPHRNGGRPAEQIIAGTGRRLAWICRRNPEHRWWATGASRLSGSGCPNCVLSQTSAREVRLAAELAAVLELSVTERRVALAGTRALHIDVLCRRRRLAIEYDGSYYHASRMEQDRRKTEQLTAMGYTVVRVREHPLPVIGPHDIVVSARDPIHGVAAQVLERLAAVRPDVLEADKAASYRAGGHTIADEAAELRLAELLAAQADRQSQRRRHG